MRRTLAAFAITLSAFLASTASAGNILFDSPNGDGLNGRFGIVDTSGTAPDGSPALEITGTPTSAFPDLIALDPVDGNAVFAITPADYGLPFEASFDVYIPTGSNLTNIFSFARFTDDLNNDGNIQFGAGSEFANRVEVFGTAADFSLLDQFQTLTLSGTVPQFDNAAVPGEIDILQFNLALRQSAAAPVTAFVNNVSFEIIPEPSTLALIALTGVAAVVRRRV